ncbi:hypothetical protein RhiirA5_438332 [Rhizophagus irregularis]|uniref:Uncharacterized protein n=1 Tax=Rhizophagus irregularis TaxID=588596 RepID=A0A2N0NJ85_9GLOM|nr:hypothetical protein RhiirA5_438332 [Rhizophagus irregularis]
MKVDIFMVPFAAFVKEPFGLYLSKYVDFFIFPVRYGPRFVFSKWVLSDQVNSKGLSSKASFSFNKLNSSSHPLSFLSPHSSPNSSHPSDSLVSDQFPVQTGTVWSSNDLLISDDDNSENEKWIEAIKCENTFDHFEDKILLDSEINNNFNFGERTIHPADDLTAKWLLQSLFISNLGFSAYLQENQIYSAL